MKSGAKVPVTVTVTNKGNTIAKGNVKIQLYASQDKVLDPGVDLKLNGTSKAINLLPGKSIAIPMTFSISGLGTDFLVAVISSPIDKVTGNNTIFSSGTVTFS